MTRPAGSSMLPAYLQPSDGRCTPPLVTPPFSSQVFHFARPKVIRRQSSLSSVSSFNSDQDEDPFTEAPEWTEMQESMLQTAYDEMAAQAQSSETPFVGTAPSQLVHLIAKAVVSRCRQLGEEWPHSLKKTRARVLVLSKRTTSEFNNVEATPTSSGKREGDKIIRTPGRVLFDPEATPKRPNLRRSKPPPALSDSPNSALDFGGAIARRGPHNLQKLSHKLTSNDGPAPYRIPLPVNRSTSYSGGSPSPLDSAVFDDSSKTANSYYNMPPTPPSSTNRPNRSQSASVMGELGNCPLSPTKPAPLVKGMLSGAFGQNSDQQHTFYQRQAVYPTPPKSGRKERPNLLTMSSGKLSAISLDSSHFEAYHPKADSELPDSPCPSLRTFGSNTSSNCSLRTLSEDVSMDLDAEPMPSTDYFINSRIPIAMESNEMALDSPFHDVFPPPLAKAII